VLQNNSSNLNLWECYCGWWSKSKITGLQLSQTKCKPGKFSIKENLKNIQTYSNDFSWYLTPKLL